MPKFVYDFTEGNRDLKDLLGGKGANLAEMTNLGLPVPPGFTITTEACQAYLQTGSEPAELADEVDQHLEALEKAMGQRLGDADDPLLVSVRSGAKFSMPGMMETVLNIGLNDESVQGLAQQAGNERFAWDSYRRLIQMFGKTVLGIDGEHFEDAHRRGQEGQGHQERPRPGRRRPADARRARSRAIVREHGGRDFPQDPREQMDLAIQAVFDSWNADRAILYRRQERIPADLGTAVNVRRWSSATSAWTPAPASPSPATPPPAHQGVYGDYLQNAQGEDVVAGIRNTLPLADLESIDKPAYDQLMQIMATLEDHYRDLCDIEFTIERGKLWMLQTRVGKRTAGAAFRIATQLVDEGLIDMDEALTRVTGAQLAQLMFPRFDETADKEQIAKGMNASPGAAVGKAVFDSDRAAELAVEGRAGHPGPPRDQPGRPGRHDRRAGHPHQPRRQDLARGGGRPRHGQDLRLRRRGARGRPEGPEVHRARRRGRHRGRRHLHRRHHRRGLPRRGAGAAVAGGAVLRGHPRPPTPTRWSRRCTGSSRTPTRCAGSACGPTPTPRRTPSGPAGSAPRASGCAGPSTCSSATAASSSRT